MKKYTFKIFLLAIMLFNKVSAQQKVIELSAPVPISGNQNWVARDAIYFKSGAQTGYSFKATSTQSMTARIDETLVFDADYSSTTVDPNARTLSTSLPVGTLPGSAGVSPVGSATYSISLEVPQGIAGIQPNILIGYSSGSGSGLLGVGWSLSGLSAITRVPKTIFDDAQSTGISFSSDNDAYVLDGNRLELVQGSSTVYETKVKSFSKIESFGSITETYISTRNTGPEWFKVTTKDGKTIEYGSSDDSRVVPGAGVGKKAPFMWLIKKVTDLNGNYMEFSYKQENGETVIEKIEYTGNGSKKGNNTIAFYYDKKVEGKAFYIHGREMPNTLLLRKVRVLSGKSTVRTYEFQYNEAQEKTYLNTVTEVGRDGKTLNPTVIGWGGIVDAIAVNNLGALSSLNDYDYKVAYDYDMDGFTDIIGIKLNGVNSHEIQIFKTIYSNGEFSFEELFPDIPFTYCCDAYRYYSQMSVKLNLRFVRLKNYSYYWRGYNAIVWPTYRYSISNGPTLEFYDSKIANLKRKITDSDEYPIYTVGDFNNDGTDEIIYFEGKTFDGVYPGNIIDDSFTPDQEPNFNLEISKRPDRLFPIDCNADGLLDLLVVNEDGYYIYRNNGVSNVNGVFKTDFSLAFSSTQFNSKYSFIESGDFNGDGLMDFVLNEHSNRVWKLALNMGNWAFNTISLPDITAVEESYTTKNNSRDHCTVLDFNHDGLSDLVITDAVYKKRHDITGDYGIFERFEIKWYKSTGSGFSLVKSLISNDENYSFKKDIVTGDFDGDGREDLLNFGSDLYSGLTNDDNYRLYNSFNSNFEEGLVKTIADGFNRKTTFQYLPLTRLTDATGRTFYTPEFMRSTYPVKDFQGALYCVSSMQQDNGIGGNSLTEYSYTGAKVQLTGKGFLGFGSQTSENAMLNRRVTSSVELDPETYLPVKQSVDVEPYSGGSTIESTKSEYSIQKVDNTLFHSVSKVIGTNVTGITTTTNYEYDSPSTGNISSIAVDYSDGAKKKTEFSGYTSLGSPTLVTNTTNHPDDGTDFSVSTKYGYDDNGNLKSKIENYGTGKEIVAEYSEFDSWGHPGKVFTSAFSEGGPLNATQTFTYDATGQFLKSTTDNIGTTSYTYDPVFQNVLSETGPTGLITRYSYNARGRLTSTSFPDGNSATTTYTWGSTTNASKPLYYITTTSTNQPFEKTGYDVLGRTVRIESMGVTNNAVKSEITYDARGQVTQTVAYLGGTKTGQVDYTYFGDGRTRTVTHMGGKTVTYTYDGTTVNENVNGNEYVREYDSWGNLKSLTEPSPGGTITYSYHSCGKPSSIEYPGSTVQMEYDELGNQKKLEDPSAGIQEYRYDGMGRLTFQRDANMNEIFPQYDEQGRLTAKKDKVGGYIVAYEYYTNGSSKGLVNKATAASEASESYEYDEYGRPIRVTSHTDNTVADMVFQYKYNAKGNVEQVTYPSGEIITNGYDGMGNLINVKYGNTNVWSLNTASATSYSYTLGNGHKTVKTFDANGMLQSIVTNNSTVHAQNTSYSFDAKEGHIDYREAPGAGYNLHESFSYDDINRLSNWNVFKIPLPVKNLSLDEQKALVPIYTSIQYSSIAGNISYKEGVGTYVYSTSNDQTKPHAVKQVKPVNGNVDLFAPDSISFTSTGKVHSITQGDYYYELTYGPDDQRVKSELKFQGELQETTYYNEFYEEKVKPDGTCTEYHYIVGGDGMAAVLIKTNGAAGMLHYLHKDHLGSIVCITDASGNIEEKMSYDAWGRRRNPTDWSFNNVLTPKLITRGYTGHEHLDVFSLINMNGRIYDPVLGQFISSDNFVQNPTNTQNFNRYAYCLNNPLIYIDPSGENFWSGFASTLCFGLYGLWQHNIAQQMGYNNFQSFMYAGIKTAMIATSVAFSSGAIGGLSGIDAVVAGGYVSGAINGAGMAAIEGGNANDIIGEMVQGGSVGSLSALASYGAFQGADQLLTKLNPFKGIGGALLFGNFPLQNTISYMASSTASQMTSNLMTGQGMFDNLDYGINPGIILPLYADIGSRVSSIRTRLVKEQYVSEDGSNVTEAWPWVRRTEIQDNGDLVVHTMFETKKWVLDYYKNKFWGGQKLVPAHMETSSFNYYNPVMVSNYRNIVQSLVISWSFK